MKTKLKYFFILYILIDCCTKSFAGYMPQPQPLVQSISKANIILLVKFEGFVSDKTHINKNILSQSQSMMYALSSYPPGQFEFSVINVLKGSFPSTKKFYIHLPPITEYYYASSISLSAGSQCLLLLNETDDHLVPVDETTPLIPLGYTNAMSLVPNRVANPTEQKVQNTIVSMMASTLNDPLVRKINMRLLRSVVNSQLPSKLIPFETDADKDFRDDVLYCLILNQQLQAIPLMAQLSEDRFKETGGAASVEAFEHLTTKKAVPYLNPLLLNVSPFTRQATAFALKQLADSTSIPYLIDGLKQPDPQGITLYEEYVTLHRLIPRLGTTQTLPYFLDNRTTILKYTTLWWAKNKQDLKLSPVQATASSGVTSSKASK